MFKLLAVALIGLLVLQVVLAQDARGSGETAGRRNENVNNDEVASNIDDPAASSRLRHEVLARIIARIPGTDGSSVDSVSHDSGDFGRLQLTVDITYAAVDAVADNVLLQEVCSAIVAAAPAVGVTDAERLSNCQVAASSSKRAVMCSRKRDASQVNLRGCLTATIDIADTSSAAAVSASLALLFAAALALLA